MIRKLDSGHMYNTHCALEGTCWYREVGTMGLSPPLLLLLLLPLPSTLAGAVTCQNARDCTNSGSASFEWRSNNCVPDTIKSSLTIFIVNIVLVIIIGTVGNLLTLLAIPYARLYYSHRFPRLSSPLTILLLHLALCDLLYCLLGLPVQASILGNGYLK
jgi:hypothetical protein